MRHVGLLGGDRTGKDTIAHLMCEKAGYQRVAIADPLKDLAVAMNARVPTPEGGCVPLGDVVPEIGWERVKDEYPAVRAVLWGISDGMCSFSGRLNYWTRLAMDTVEEIEIESPCVVTDIRTFDEALDFNAKGFFLARVWRPGVDTPTPVPDWRCDIELVNEGPETACRKLLDLV